METAISASMPGSRKSLPPTPRFAPPVPPASKEGPGDVSMPSTASTSNSTNALPAAINDPETPKLRHAAGGAPTPSDGISEQVAVESDDPLGPTNSIDGADVIVDGPKPVNGGPIPTLAPPQSPTPDIAASVSQSATTAPVQAEPVSQEPIPAASSAPAAAAAAVSVNLGELQARISGYHAGLAKVRGEAVRAGASLSLPAATKLVAELEEIAREREFVELYYAALTPEERRSVDQPSDLAGTAEALAAALDEAAAATEATFDPFATGSASPFGKLRERVEQLAQ